MRLLPPATVPGRVLAISVDLPRALLDTSRADGEQRDGFVPLLCRIFEAHDVPATWGLDDPQSAAALRSLLPRATRHEVALRHDPSTAGAGRPHAFRALVAHARAAQQAGHPTSTLLTRGELPAAELELLARMGINLVADQIRLAKRGGPMVETVRYGMWRLAASRQVPVRSGWLRCRMASVRTCSQIDRAIARDELFHIAIDGANLAPNRSAMSALERVLRHVNRRRHRGLLQVLTLAEVARQLPLPRHGAAAHSILKSKAA